VRRLAKPGSVFSCPITSQLTDCTELDVEINNPLAKDDKNGQWLGVSVTSQGTRDGMALVSIQFLPCYSLCAILRRVSLVCKCKYQVV
jgi:hypothetical protein